MENCKGCHTPKDSRFQIQDEERVNGAFRQLIVNRMYLSQTSRPDTLSHISVEYLTTQ